MHNRREKAGLDAELFQLRETGSGGIEAHHAGAPALHFKAEAVGLHCRGKKESLIRSVKERSSRGL